MDMSFVYSIAQCKKMPVDIFKKIIAIASIPIAIEGYPLVLALQGGISLINYLCTADDVMKLTDKLFEFRGPVVISDVYDVSYDNKRFDPTSNNTTIPKRESTSRGLKQDALDDFLEIKTIVANQIKNIKEPIVEIK